MKNGVAKAPQPERGRKTMTRSLKSMIAALAVFATLGARAAEDIDAVVADLQRNNLTAEEIRLDNSLKTLTIVDLSQFRGEDLQALQEVLEDTEDGFAEIQTAIEANETFEGPLREAGVDVWDVTAATRDEGRVTVYTNMPTR